MIPKDRSETMVMHHLPRKCTRGLGLWWWLQAQNYNAFQSDHLLVAEREALEHLSNGDEKRIRVSFSKYDSLLQILG